jgi:hypothetical protein
MRYGKQAAVNKAAAIERAKALAPVAELEGKSASEIARVLNDRGVPTPSGASPPSSRASPGPRSSTDF